MAAYGIQCFQLFRATSSLCYQARTDNNCPRVSVARDSSAEVSLESKVDTLMDKIKWDDKGLAVAIAQNIDPCTPGRCPNTEQLVSL